MARLPWRSLAGLVLWVLLALAATEGWRAYQAGKLAQQLVARVRPGDILMLSSETCVFCDRARRWMTQQALPFTECFIESDADCARRYQATGAQGTPTLLVRGRLQLGFSPDRLLAAL